MESASKTLDGFKPLFWIDAYPQQDGRKIGIDGAPFVRTCQAS